MILPPPMVRSLFKGEAPIPKEMPKLPFSPPVALLVNDIEGHLVEDGREMGGYLRTKKFIGKTAKFYRPHNSSWPVKPPSLDKDAVLIGVAKPPSPALGVEGLGEHRHQSAADCGDGLPH